MTQPVKIIMVEDDHGHAKLIEKNIRRANINNEIKHFDEGTAALERALRENEALRRKGGSAAEEGLPVIQSMVLEPLPDILSLRLPDEDAPLLSALKAMRRALA
ncbi:MAG: hypothetical protein LCH57_10785, partial [Proteobacteria bacterium]|nr:hypothetical protein [Pseudomonadota bacterium]